MTVTVVLTREAPLNDGLRQVIGPHCRVLEVPLSVTQWTDAAAVEDAVTNAQMPEPCRVLALTSARSARYIRTALTHVSADCVIAVVGPATAEAVSNELAANPTLGPRQILVAPESSARSMASVITTGPVLWLSGTPSRDDLAQALAEKGIELRTVVCYASDAAVLGGLANEEVTLAEVIVISSPLAWTRARASVRAGTWVVTLGDATAAAVRADDHHEAAHVVVTTPAQLSNDLIALIGRLGE